MEVPTSLDDRMFDLEKKGYATDLLILAEVGLGHLLKT